MSTEEIRIALGIDNSQISRGMVQAEREIKKSGDKMTASLQASLGGLKTGLLAGGLMNVFGMVEGAMQRLSDFMDKSAELGDWWGKFSVGGLKAAGIIGEADAAFALASRRARKLNQERWAEEVRLAEQAAKALEEYYKRAREAQKDLRQRVQEREENSITDTAEAIRYNEEILKRLKAERESLKNHDEQDRKQIEIMDREDKITALKKKQADEQKRLNDAISEQKRRIEDIKRGQIESFMPTVDELAESGFWEANRIKFLEQDTRRVFRQFRNPDMKYVQANIDEINTLKGSLERSNNLAQDPSKKAMIDAEATLKRLEENGIKVKGAN